ncbi:MAG: hypothetical protein O6933_05900 [Planctomycetota bacterium]|nr:hypothetical protein [Planctomycetota bacterium]
MNRRGLTLLELLLAIGLLLAMAALALPTVLKGFGERAFESSAEVARNQLLLGRAHAQAAGQPVEVTYYSPPSRIEARLFRAGLRGIEQGQPQAARSADDGLSDPPSFSDEEESDPEPLIPEGWASRLLANGVWITDRPPGRGPRFDEGGLAAVEGDRQPRDGLSEPRRRIRLAVFLPDGSALLGEPAWIGDADGRLGKLQVNPWTGLPSFQRLAQAEGQSHPLDEMDRQDEPDWFAPDQGEPQETPQQPKDGEADSRVEEVIEP